MALTILRAQHFSGAFTLVSTVGFIISHRLMVPMNFNTCIHKRIDESTIGCALLKKLIVLPVKLTWMRVFTTSTGVSAPCVRPQQMLRWAIARAQREHGGSVGMVLGVRAWRGERPPRMKTTGGEGHVCALRALPKSVGASYASQPITQTLPYQA